MRFTSVEFLIFCLVTISAYFLAKRNYVWQNAILLAASYIFYSFFDWRFLGLLVISTIVNFFSGRSIYINTDLPKRKTWLIFALAYSLLILGFFKYFNFFEENFLKLFELLGLFVSPTTLKIILPLGISYYIFQGLTYPLEIYKNKVKPVDSILDFALFTSFFPTIVSGPIERANHLLTQIQGPRSLDYNKISMAFFLIVWGCFQKLVIADNAGLIADAIFNNYGQYYGLDILAGIIAFTIQIYCDFSGYTDITRGIAQLLGFELLLNFKAPYFARNPSDFWGRWHISLSSWFRDYLYIPLGGNRKGKLRTFINLVTTMAICGLWHGAAWNYIIWGIYHGVLLCIYRARDIGFGAAQNYHQRLSRFTTLGQIMLMFLLVSFSWAIFRASSPDAIIYMVSNLSFSISASSINYFLHIGYLGILTAMVNTLQYKNHYYYRICHLRPWIQGIIFGIIITLIIIFAPREIVHFIYQGF